MLNRFLILFSVFALGCLGFKAQTKDTLALSLEDALSYAREHNYDKQAAILNIDIAGKKVKETIGIGLPQVNGNAGYTNNLKLRQQPFGDQLITLGTKNTGSLGFGLNQLLFDGSYIVGVQATKAYEKISELSALKTDEALVSAVLQLYSSIIITKATIDVYNENLQTLDKNLYQVTKIYEVGLGEEQTVEQMTYNLNIMKNSILNAENILKILYTNFKYVLNVEDDAPIKLTTDFDEIIAGNTTLVDESSFENLDDQIDNQIAANQVITDKLQLKYEKSKYLPSLGGYFNTDYNAFSDKFDLFSQKWYNTTAWGLSLNIPIFSGFQRKARVSQAKYQLEISQLMQDKTAKDVQRQAQESYLTYQNALLQYDLAKQQVALSESIYNKENIKFFEGLGGSLNLTQAETQVFQAQTQMIQTISQVVDAKIALDKALGNFNLTIQ